MSAFEAMNIRNNVPALQAKLSRAAKQSLDRKFGALYKSSMALWVSDFESF